MNALVVYGRPGCHLCEILTEELEPLVGGRLPIRHVDVTGDAELERRYGLRVPVVVCGEQELSSYPLDRDRVERHLAALPL
jgi:hypothetical protein